MAASEFLADQIVVFRADGSGQIRTLLAQNLRQGSQRALSLAQSYTSLGERSARSAPHLAAASTGPDIVLRAVRMEDVEDRDYRRRLFAAAAEHHIDAHTRVEPWTDVAAVNVWDGTGVVVMTGSGMKHVTDLNGATICVRPGTITELDVADWVRRKEISYNPVLIGNELERGGLHAGRCDALTTDTSQLAGFPFSLGPKAAGLTILPEQIATGPLDPWLFVSHCVVHTLQERDLPKGTASPAGLRQR